MTRHATAASHQPRAEKTRVFLSHAWGPRHKQHEFAGELCDLLKRRPDLEPILDEEHFLPGTPWRDIVRALVDTTPAVVLLLFSREFLLSSNCMYELDQARNAFLVKGAPLIAVRIDDCRLPPLLAGQIYVDMRKAFELFTANDGAFQAELAARTEDLIRGIRGQIGKFREEVHITRVIHPKDVALLDSRTLYTQYPSAYRDPFEAIQQCRSRVSLRLRWSRSLV